MTHLKSLLHIFVLLLLFTKTNAQVQTARHISTTPNSNGFYEYLPQGYNPNSTETYPVIIFIHGLGELGDGSPWQLPKMLWAGLPATINGGQFPTSVTVNGQTHKFIVISPQFISWPGSGDVENVINYTLANYRVNTQRVYLTGLSMGGGVTWEYAGSGVAQASRLAAIVPICGASWPEFGRARNITQANLPVWGIHNNDDAVCPVFYTNDYVSFINQAPAPAVLAKKTINQWGGHDAWTNTYNGNTTDAGMNIYQWLLQYQQGTPPPGYNQAPVANAGPDQVLAASASSVQLNGSGTDPDGTIASYAWTKVSGPSSFSFNNSTIPNPFVSNLSKGKYNFKLTVTDDKGATSSSTVNITLPDAVPGKIEAENYIDMSGIQTEGTNDIGGGLNLGWQDNNDWMDYAVDVAFSGTFTVNFRVASYFSGAQFQLRKADGTVLTTVTVPNTGGFQNWQTVSVPVSLTAGPQTLRIVTTNANGGWNFNWWEVVGTASAPPPPPPPPSSSPTSSLKIEAEHYSNMSGIQTEPTSDVGGGLNVGWQDNNDWMDFSVNISTAGTYTVNFRVASYFGGAQFQVRKSDGTVLTTVTVPNTGSFQTWQTISAQITLPAGQQTLRLFTTNANGGWNINWWEIVGTTTTEPTPAPAPPPSTATSIKIEAELYSNMSGIQTETTSDIGGGLNVGWQDNNDWMDYAVNISAAGTYTVNFRVSSYFGGAQFQLRKSDGTVLTTVTVPNTGGFQTWQTVSAQATLVAGLQTLRIFTSNANGGWNINWWEIAGAVTTTEPPPAPTSTKIEAENYATMAGVQTEPTSDVGGGLNVGWQDNNDWMDYAVNISASGIYTLNFRVASYFSGAQFQVRKADGTVLATVTVPNTGGFQKWQTTSIQVNLAAGQQTLRLFTSNANGGWNINWWEITPGTSTAVQKSIAPVQEEVLAAETVELFPNPATDKLVVKVSNTLAGALKIDVVNLQGAIVKSVSLNKQSGSNQYYLSVGDLPVGQYNIRLTMTNWTENKMIIKQ
ncbi:MAG: carbohydrate-binding protein [Flavisolibacter sp.]|nr:carbohydrate-binding protein [Flavisolibacter sp.]